ncbi:hypothetical protein B0H14DRAFT_1261415 [Mycena olivaceomarginata]|nr:hypothetical protein B0H14DRAFT_1261415 [Mycena olivaceomarginata]
MLSLRPNHLAFLFLFHCLFLALSPANAVPVVIKRQSDGQSTTVMTQSTTSTPAGDMTQKCVVQLTPITDDQGNPAVREVRTCTLSMDPVNNNGNSGSSTNATSTDTSNSGSSSTDTSGSSSTDTSGGASSTGASGATSTADSGASANGVSSVAPASASASASASATDSAGASAASASTTAGPNTSNTGGAAVSGVTSIAATAVSGNSGGAAGTPAAASAADQGAPSASQSSAFAVPGQKIQVLPIGLGVFAGISVIALIVVGLVTYERTKYRKAFRARKLAESGAGMGYGGMAQR